MSTLNFYPKPYEMKAFMAVAVLACDALDELTSLPTLCHFDLFSLVGQNCSCDRTASTFSRALLMQLGLVQQDLMAKAYDLV